MQIEEALEHYTTQLEADGRSGHTIAQVRRHMRLSIAWLAANASIAEIENLTHEHIARFLASDVTTKRADGAPRKATSANALRSSVRTFCGYVHAAGYVAANPARLVRRARCGAPKPKALSDAEVAKLRAAMDTARTPAELRDRALFTTLLDAGLRIGSALGVDVEDVDLEVGELRLRWMKNSDQGTVFVPTRTATILRKFLGERTSGPLFPALHGGRMGTRSAHRRLEIWATRAGLSRRLSPHMLRHTFATGLYRRTGDVLLVGRALCHRSIASTAVYAQVDAQRLKAALRT